MGYLKSVINVGLVIYLANVHFTNAVTVSGTCAFNPCFWGIDYCQNGGSCSLNETTCVAACICGSGFGGDRCEIALGEESDRLQSTTTSQSPSSVANPAPSSCVFNPCLVHNYCLNNGKCSLEETTCKAHCDCPKGATGNRCQDTGNVPVNSTAVTDVSKSCTFNPCSSTFSICQNNGKCKLNYTTCASSCACLDGYTGSTCEIRINVDGEQTTTTEKPFCTFNPCVGIPGFCFNNGTCSVDRNTCVAKCTCNIGFHGKRCEFKTDSSKTTTKAPEKRKCAFNPCIWSSNYCKNDGECKLNETHCLAYCTCSNGYTGDRCENVIGTGSTSAVPPTTSERVCAFDICAWSTGYCDTGGTCTLDKISCMPKCHCADGFSGEQCKDKVVTESPPTTNDPDDDGGVAVDCLENPCENVNFCFHGAACVHDQETCTATCDCPEGYTGARCNVTGVTTDPSVSQAYNVCRDGALQRTEKERVCRPSGAIQCVHGVCRGERKSEGGYTGISYTCLCDPGAQGTFCEKLCCLDCGPNGRCHKGDEEDAVESCACNSRWDGEFCEVYIPLPVRVEFAENTWYLWVVGVCVGTFVLLVLLAVITPYWMWRHRVILIMKIVHYFQAYEDDDEKEWDAFVSYKADEVDERFVVQVLYPKLEKELGFRLCLHFRDFVPGETISNNIINAVEGSRRTILVLTPRYIKSEFTRFEYQKAQEEMLKRKHRIIPLVLEDIAECKPAMDKNLKGILGSVTYLEWPEVDSDIKKDKFWKRLHLSMPKKKVSEFIPGEKSYGSSQTGSTPVNSNIYSDGYEANSQSVYMEIGEIDENMSTVIRPLSEKEELELANSSKYFTAKETVKPGEEPLSDDEKVNNLKNLDSHLRSSLRLDTDDMKIDLTDMDKLKVGGGIIDLTENLEGQVVTCSEYIV